MGPSKHAKDTVGILEEEDPIGGNARRMKRWDEIHKGLSQRFSIINCVLFLDLTLFVLAGLCIIMNYVL